MTKTTNRVKSIRIWLGIDSELVYVIPIAISDRLQTLGPCRIFLRLHRLALAPPDVILKLVWVVLALSAADPASKSLELAWWGRHLGLSVESPQGIHGVATERY